MVRDVVARALVEVGIAGSGPAFRFTFEHDPRREGLISIRDVHQEENLLQSKRDQVLWIAIRQISREGTQCINGIAVETLEDLDLDQTIPLRSATARFENVRGCDLP